MFSFISNVHITHHIDLTSRHLHLSAGRAGPRQQLRVGKGQPQTTTSLLLADSCSGPRDEQLSLGRWNRSVSRKWIQSRIQRDTKWHFMSQALSSCELNVLRLEEVLSLSLRGSSFQPGFLECAALAGGESTDSRVVLLSMQITFRLCRHSTIGHPSFLRLSSR